MNVRLWGVAACGVVLGALLGCPSTPACDASSCAGCCAENGVDCLQGDLDQSCGVSGASCVACGAAQRCVAGACASAGDGGTCVASDENTDATCTNGKDDDCDGFLDCGDFSCSKNPQVTKCGTSMDPDETTDALCSNGLDDDKNGYQDCQDWSCSRGTGISVCKCVPSPESTQAACSDGLDNDCNGFVDCRDFNCKSPAIPACCPNPGPEGSDEACSDGLDNDCDGYADCKDFSCSKTPAVHLCGFDAGVCMPTGAENTATACDDGKDNDCDGKGDCNDPDCAALQVCAKGTTPACSSCTKGTQCVGGRCVHFTSSPTVSFCSNSCTVTADCAPTMYCHGSGVCVPRLKERCTPDAGAIQVVDDCGHTYSTNNCVAPLRCTPVSNGADCLSPPKPPTVVLAPDCYPCDAGAQCTSGKCSKYGSEPVGFCSRPCQSAANCQYPFNSCQGGVCVKTSSYDDSLRCSADGKQVLKTDGCGAITSRETCDSSESCQRPRASLYNLSPSPMCLDKCYGLNGTSGYGGYIVSCYYTYSSASGKCCGKCSDSSSTTCTTPY